MSVWWIGVDPGGRWTGLALVNPHHQYVTGLCVTRVTDAPTRLGVGNDYLDAVCAGLQELRDHAVAADPQAVVMVALEDVAAPNPHLGITDPADIIRAAFVYGAVRRDYPGAVIVDLGENGSSFQAAYPPPLRKHRSPGATPGGFTSAERPHMRSALDVAHKGPAAERTQILAAATPRQSVPIRSKGTTRR